MRCQTCLINPYFVYFNCMSFNLLQFHKTSKCEISYIGDLLRVQQWLKLRDDYLDKKNIYKCSNSLLNVSPM